MRIVGWEDAEVRQTHISTVLVGPDRVLKCKKPVAMGFLDFSTLEARAEACREEARLNDRTAPGVTLGVRRLTAEADSALAVDGPGVVVDYAVEMRRLPDERRLSALLEADVLRPEHLEQVGQWLARFHADAPRCDDHGTPAAVSSLIEENFAQTPEAEGILGFDGVAAVRRFQLELVASGWVDRRLEEGCVRDGHGDLRLDHVYLLGDLAAPEVVAIDGIEFSDRYRCADVAADLAFLAMDLRLSDRSDLAEGLVAAWARQTGDWGVYGVIDRYVAYRAWIRAKVHGLQGHDVQARQRFALAHEIATAPGTSGGLVVVAGPIASGKSTLALRLSQALHAPVIDADRTRKQRLGVSVDTSLGTAPFTGAYADDVTEQVYAALMDCAEPALVSGRTVVLDASFRSRPLQDLARRRAEAIGVSCRFVVCRAPESVLRERLETRTSGPSDARAPILDSFLQRYRAPEGADVVFVDTTEPLDLDRILAFITPISTEVPDGEHRQVLRLVEKLRQGDTGAVFALASLLPGHFAFEERPEGFFDRCRAKGAAPEADRLQAQHAEILSAVASLTDPIPDERAKLLALADLLEAHERDENALAVRPAARRMRGW